jgi:hypothetical protein
MFRANFYLIICRTLLKELIKEGPEGSGRKNFEIETRNAGWDK